MEYLKGDQDQSSSHWLVHFPNACHSWYCARTKQDALSQGLQSGLPCEWQEPKNLNSPLPECAIAGSWSQQPTQHLHLSTAIQDAGGSSGIQAAVPTVQPGRRF